MKGKTEDGEGGWRMNEGKDGIRGGWRKGRKEDE